MKNKFKPKFVTSDQLQTTAMVNGNEKKFPIILDTALVKKRWVGFGWVTEGVADAEDIKRYPILKDTTP
jgi:hypothetical protein